MHGPDKRPSSSSSSPTKRPQTLNENDKSYQEIGPILQSPKRPVKKHYMSPTIAAASKAILPKKKILGENNQPKDTHLQKNPNTGASQESLTRKTPSHSTELDENEQNHAFVTDPAASKPYDPVTNYLSPRPKFLRYQPNRCREILRRKENEKNDGSDVSSVSTSCSFESKKEDSEDDACVGQVGAEQVPVGLREEDDYIRSSINDSFGEEIDLIGAKEASIDEENALIGAKEASIGEKDSLDSLNSIIEDGLVVSQEGSIGSSEDGSIKLEEAFVHGLTVEQDVSVDAQEASSGSSEDGLIKQENAPIGAQEASVDSSFDFSMKHGNALVGIQESLIDSSSDGSMKQEDASIHGSTVEQDVSVGAQEEASIRSSIQEAFLYSSFDGSMKQEDDLVAAREAPIGSSADDLTRQESEETDDDFEEIEEVRAWGLTKLLKFSLVLVALVFSTSYIVTINSSSPSVPVQAIRSLGSQYYFIPHSVYEFVKSFEDGRQLDGAERTFDEGIWEENENADDLTGNSKLPSGESAERKSLENEVVEINVGEEKAGGSDELDEVCDDEMAESNELFAQMAVEEFESSDGVGNHENAISIKLSEAFSSVADGNPEKVASIEVSESQTAEVDQVCDDEIEKTKKILDQMAVEEFESRTSFHESQIPVVSNVETDRAADGNPASEIIMERIEVVDNSVDTDQNGDEKDGTENTVDDNSNPSIVNPEWLPSLKDELIKYMESKLYIFGIPIVLASLIFGLRFMNKEQVKKDSSKVQEKFKPILAHNDNTEKDKKPYSFVKSTSMVNSLKEGDSSESYESQTEEVSSFKSRSMKNQMAESEKSSQSISVEKGHSYKAQSASSYSQPALSESSYGSFTTETRIFKKKKDNRDGGGYSGEITTTPVRRSSRILKREILSP